MKKWMKRAVKTVLIGGLLVILLDGGLHLLSRTEWFEARVENALKGTLGREIDLGPLGANLSGVFVKNVKIAEKGGFAQGVFVQAKRLQVRFSLLHLLHGHTKINWVTLSDVHVKLTVTADGTASWEDLTAAPTPPQEPADAAQPFPWAVTAGRVRLENLHLTYVDEQTPRTLDINGLNLDVKNFSLGQEFPLQMTAQLRHQETNFERLIPLTLKARVNLQQLDLEKAYVNIQSLKAYYQPSSLAVQGTVENFVNPQINLQITLRKFSSALLKGVTPVPPFDLQQATATLKAAANLQDQAVTLHHLGVQAPGVELKAKGGLLYKDKLQYEATATFNLILGEAGRWFTALAEPYQAVGTVESTWTATQEKITAQIALQEVGAHVPQAGRLANLNGKISAEEKMDFKTGNAQIDLAGKLNANPFTVALNADQTPQQINATLKAYAKEFMLSAAPRTEEPGPAQPTAAPAEKTAWPLPPIALQADIQLDEIDVPYFWGKGVVFSSNLEGITPDLKQAHGVLRLTTAEGKIQDIYKLTDANPITKVLFLSLNVTGKVFNSLNVLGVLNSLGSGVVNAVSGGSKDEDTAVKTQTILGPDGEPLEVPVTDEVKQVSGEMEYDKFDTEVNFVRGLATIKEGTFVSPMMSFRLDGTVDFNSGALDMTVRAAPGRHKVDGMMPLSLKIGGTVDNPQGNMQLLGSVTSLVTQSVTNNVVSRNVTKGVKGFFGLFKKKDEKEN